MNASGGGPVIRGAAQGGLDLGLLVQRLGEAVPGGVVELFLDARVGGGRAGRQPGGERARDGRQVRVRTT